MDDYPIPDGIGSTCISSLGAGAESLKKRPATYDGQQPWCLGVPWRLDIKHTVLRMSQHG